jgi:putative acetyltransferase
MDVTIEIRTARPEDSAAVQEVHTKAFGGPAEAKLVRLISERKKAVISLVATNDGKVDGHILFSRVTIANAPDTFNAVGLAPVAVLPEFQRQGIGSKLIREGLKQCQQAGYDVVVLLGYPATTPASASHERRTSVYRMNTACMMNLWCCRYTMEPWRRSAVW